MTSVCSEFSAAAKTPRAASSPQAGPGSPLAALRVVPAWEGTSGAGISSVPRGLTAKTAVMAAVPVSKSLYNVPPTAASQTAFPHVRLPVLLWMASVRASVPKSRLPAQRAASANLAM